MEAAGKKNSVSSQSTAKKEGETSPRAPSEIYEWFMHILWCKTCKRGKRGRDFFEEKTTGGE